MGFMSKKFKDELSGGKYWKTKDMEEGEHRFRVVQKPVFGWVDWKDNQPFRYRENNKPKKPFNEAKPIKSFVSLYVWDYDRKSLSILEFNQKTILLCLDKIVKNSLDELVNYDLKLLKIGQAKESRYTIKACPESPLSQEIRQAVSNRPANLDALYDGGDPWGLGALESTIDVSGDSDDPFTVIDDPGANKGPFDMIPLMTPFEELREHLQVEDIDTSRLEEWIKLRAQTKNETAEAVIKACLAREILPKFKKAFAKFIAPLDDNRALTV